MITLLLKSEVKLAETREDEFHAHMHSQKQPMVLFSLSTCILVDTSNHSTKESKIAIQMVYKRE